MHSTLPQETTPELPTGRAARAGAPGGGAAPPLRTVLAVAAGGTIGAVLRVWFAHTFANLPGRFPWTTFLENILGAFLLGLILVALLERLRPRRTLQPFLATGILGSFTTFSNFTVEMIDLAGQRPLIAIIYSAASIIVGLAAAFLGMTLARRWPRPPVGSGPATVGTTVDTGEADGPARLEREA